MFSTRRKDYRLARTFFVTLAETLIIRLAEERCLRGFCVMAATVCRGCKKQISSFGSG
jgi:hypothetical protein